MTLPLSGKISASQINVELGKASNSYFNIGMPSVRGLAGKPSGAISFQDFHGKSSYVREPETGENYNPPNSSAPTYWAVSTSGAGFRQRLYWEGELITTYFWHSTNALVHGNWLYHIGEFKGSFSIGNSGWYNIYGVWRETAPAGSQTREPPTDAWYDVNNRWRERQGQSWVVWDGVRTFAGAGGFDHKVLNGWDYFRGDYVGNGTEDGFVYNYYKVYRVKL